MGERSASQGLQKRPDKFSKLPVFMIHHWLRQKCLLFLPAAGNRNNNNGTLNNRGSNGYYWSSTENGTNNAWNLNFNSAGANTNNNNNNNNNNNRSNGFSVRCIAVFTIGCSSGGILNAPHFSLYGGR
jgi:hypothetical protein